MSFRPRPGLRLRMTKIEIDELERASAA